MFRRNQVWVAGATALVGAFTGLAGNLLANGWRWTLAAIFFGSAAILTVLEMLRARGLDGHLVAPGDATGPPAPETASGSSRPVLRWLPIMFLVAATLTLLALPLVQAPAASTPPGGSAFHSDDFSTNHGWLGAGDGHQEGPTINGTLALTAGKGSPRTRYAYLAPYRDLPESVVEIDVTLVTGRGEFGVTCRQWDSSGYRFAIQDTGYVGIFRTSDTSVPPPIMDWRPTAAVHTSGVNRVITVCRNVGDAVHLEFWINGQHVGTGTDSTHPLFPGVLGCYVHNERPQELTVEFDNMVARKP